jgi:hypothetical protein
MRSWLVTYVKAGTEYDEAFQLTERTLGNSVVLWKNLIRMDYAASRK